MDLAAHPSINRLNGSYEGTVRLGLIKSGEDPINTKDIPEQEVSHLEPLKTGEFYALKYTGVATLSNNKVLAEEGLNKASTPRAKLILKKFIAGQAGSRWFDKGKEEYKKAMEDVSVKKLEDFIRAKGLLDSNELLECLGSGILEASEINAYWFSDTVRSITITAETKREPERFLAEVISVLKNPESKFRPETSGLRFVVQETNMKNEPKGSKNMLRINITAIGPERIPNWRLRKRIYKVQDVGYVEIKTVEGKVSSPVLPARSDAKFVQMIVLPSVAGRGQLLICNGARLGTGSSPLETADIEWAISILTGSGITVPLRAYLGIIKTQPRIEQALKETEWFIDFILPLEQIELVKKHFSTIKGLLNKMPGTAHKKETENIQVIIKEIAALLESGGFLWEQLNEKANRLKYILNERLWFLNHQKTKYSIKAQGLFNKAKMVNTLEEPAPRDIQAMNAQEEKVRLKIKYIWQDIIPSQIRKAICGKIVQTYGYFFNQSIIKVSLAFTTDKYLNYILRMLVSADTHKDNLLREIAFRNIVYKIAGQAIDDYNIKPNKINKLIKQLLGRRDMPGEYYTTLEKIINEKEEGWKQRLWDIYEETSFEERLAKAKFKEMLVAYIQKGVKHNYSATVTRDGAVEDFAMEISHKDLLGSSPLGRSSPTESVMPPIVEALAKRLQEWVDYLDAQSYKPEDPDDQQSRLIVLRRHFEAYPLSSVFETEVEKPINVNGMLRNTLNQRKRFC